MCFRGGFEYPKEFHQLHIDYLLAPDKIEIKKEVLSNYQLKTVDFIIFLLVIFKNWYLTFWQRKICASLWKIAALFMARIEVEKKYIVCFNAINHNG